MYFAPSIGISIASAVDQFLFCRRSVFMHDNSCRAHYAFISMPHNRSSIYMQKAPLATNNVALRRILMN